MLVWLSQFLVDHFHWLRVFQYLTFRSIISVLTSLFIVFFFCPAFIRGLTRLQIGQSVRTDGPQQHLQKTGTPTMGGVLIILTIAITILLWGILAIALYGLRYLFY